MDLVGRNQENHDARNVPWRMLSHFKEVADEDDNITEEAFDELFEKYVGMNLSQDDDKLHPLVVFSICSTRTTINSFSTRVRDWNLHLVSGYAR